MDREELDESPIGSFTEDVVEIGSQEDASEEVKVMLHRKKRCLTLRLSKDLFYNKWRNSVVH